jgi:hypothetical protein
VADIVTGAACRDLQGGQTPLHLAAMNGLEQGIWIFLLLYFRVLNTLSFSLIYKFTACTETLLEISELLTFLATYLRNILMYWHPFIINGIVSQDL